MQMPTTHQIPATQLVQLPNGSMGHVPSSAWYGFYPATMYQTPGQPYALPPAVLREMSMEPPHAQEAAATSVSAETVQRTAEAVAASAVAAAQAAASHGQSHSPEHVAAQAQAYWSMPPGVIPMVPGTVPGSVPGGMGVTMPAGVGGAAANPEMWLQDEREVKRQRRKQSNRESARRSRLRKQAECDDLGTRATKLVEENEQLRSENDKFKHLITQLLAEKQAVVDQLKRMGMAPEEPTESVELPALAPPHTPPPSKNDKQAQVAPEEALVFAQEEPAEEAEAAPEAVQA